MSTERSHRSRTRIFGQAARADRLDLYEQAVQSPESEVGFMSRIFRKLRGRDALILREDFCGTAAISLAWARSKRSRVAYGVDLDAPTLTWATEHRIHPAGPRVRERIHLIHGNVLEARTPRADLACAMNFSYWVFKKRPELIAYFRTAWQGLKHDGVLFLDLYGGTEATIESHYDKDIDGEFTYRWEQAEFQPMTNEQVCHIHFLFPDGSSLEPAFSYNWRLWTAPEIREALEEAGYSSVHFFWRKTDREGEDIDAYYEPRHIKNQPKWWAYMVACR